jgi:hypothetical protein
LGAVFNSEAKTFGHFDEGDLIGGGGLEIFLGAVVVEDGGHVVAEGQGGHDAFQALLLGF